MLHNNSGNKKKDNLVSALIHKFIPFWPYFLGLLLLFLITAWVYLQLATPVYGVTAKLIIKDEKKGVDDSKMMESINPFDSKKIVENEIQVLQSRAVMKRVVDSLYLYAPISEEKTFKTVSAYTTSPVQIQLKNADVIPLPSGYTPQHHFTFDPKSGKIRMDDNTYPLNQWIKFPFGTLMFTANNKQNASTDNPLFFELINPKIAVNDLLGNLEASATDKLSTVVNLNFRDPVIKRGEDILNNIILSYSQQALDQQNKLAATTLDYIEKRILNVEQDLNALQGEVQQFRSTQGAIDLSEQGKLYLQEAGDNDRKISDINRQLAILDRVEQYVISKDAESGIVPSTAGIDDLVLSQLLDKLYNSEIEYARLKKTTAENNPILLSISEEIKKVRPSIIENIRNQKSNLNASLGNLNSTSGKFNTVLKSIPEKERALLEIKRREAIKHDLFSFLLQKREETALIYAPTARDSKVVELAEASLYPVSPSPLIVYAIAIILAFSVGIIYVVGKEQINNKVLFRSEIESATNIPVFGEVWLTKQKKENYFVKPTEAMIVEQFRQLDSKLGLYSRAVNKRNVLVTSSISGEGKSFVSTNLAYSLAHAGKKVVLLDMDLRKPNTSRLFNLKDDLGILQFLKNEATYKEILNREKETDNLYVIAAGTSGGDFTQLLLNGKLDVLFGHLKNDFDYIIIDSPPIDITSDANLLAEYSDIVLLVIRHAFTPKTIVGRLDQTENSKIMENAQIVFNGVKPRGFVKGSGYGYGYAHEAYASR